MAAQGTSQHRLPKQSFGAYYLQTIKGIPCLARLQFQPTTSCVELPSAPLTSSRPETAANEATEAPRDLFRRLGHRLASRTGPRSSPDRRLVVRRRGGGGGASLRNVKHIWAPMALMPSWSHWAHQRRRRAAKDSLRVSQVLHGTCKTGLFVFLTHAPGSSWSLRG